MNYKNLILIGLVIVGFAGIAIYIAKSQKKIVYVQIGELYNEFQMKKELEATYITVQKGRKQQLDSLELELTLLNKKLDNDGSKKDLLEMFDAKKETYLMKKQQFEEDDAQMQQQYTDKIRKQLNQYVMDYGKENNCDYILGAEGSGAVMYGKDNDDVTKEVLLYVNNKFKGGK